MKNIRLNANENPYNTINNKSLIEDIQSFEFNRYPDASYLALRKAISGVSKIAHEKIIATNGSDELIQLLILAFSNPNDTILALEPTFSEYRKIASYLQRDYQGLKPNENLSLNKEIVLKNIKKYTPKVIFLCTPNNPTGEVLDQDFIINVLKNTNSIVALDEAYIEFSSADNLNLLKSYDNLVIMRTLSKAYGLASLRVGYGLANEKLIESLNKCRMPYNISGISAFIATKAIKSIDVKKYKQLLINEKNRILETFKRLGIEYLESSSNFVLFKLDNVNPLYDQLVEKGIFIRKFKEKELKNYLRFSVGTKEENTKLIKIVEEVILNANS
jgi:histidinol-phosphate aminotransferase